MTSPAPADVPTAEQVMRQAGAENFPVALWFLPPRLRRHLRAIYGYARFVDDLGDELEGDRLAALDRVEADLDRAYTSQEPELEAVRNVVPTIRAFDIPRAPFDKLIEANRQDQRLGYYRKYEDLLAYCELSANPVGHLVLHVLGAATPERMALSDDVCTALQLVEHWQDVREDFERDRVYIPQDDAMRFAVREEDLLAEHAPVHVRALVQQLVDRARRQLQDGQPLVQTLSGWGKVAVAGYVGGGFAALEAVEAAECDVNAGPPRPSKAAKLRWTWKVIRENDEE
jgi:squalene synthase HpnC